MSETEEVFSGRVFEKSPIEVCIQHNIPNVGSYLLNLWQLSSRRDFYLSPRSIEKEAEA